MSANSQNIQVAVRCRPLNERELKQNSVSVIDCNEKRKEIYTLDKNAPVPTTKTFTFDKVFGVTSKQSEVYYQIVQPVVLEVIAGYNCTMFAYGQTGTGKTFTMEGNSSSLLNDDAGSSWENDPFTGIIPRSVAHLFTILNSQSTNCEYSVKISFIELYNEELSDLLSDTSDKLRIFDDPNRKGSVIIPGLEEVVVQNKGEVYKILQKGAEKRQKASTLMNSQSSRSHSIFSITVFIKEKSLEGEEILKVGKLNLVDLAGSENIERSGATGKRAAEAGKINKSLTTLGRVITALVEHRDHIPYRESNLTRLLQDSLGGKTKTTIIATISPAQCNLEETLSTLDYAHKAKSIRNKPELNQKVVKKELIKEYTEEIDKLKRELTATREKNGIYLPQELHESMITKIDNQKDEIRDLLSKITNLNEELDKLNEQYKETKHSLDERTVALKQTEKKLNITELNLAASRQECEESKFIIEEKSKTEQVLNQQATNLLATNQIADSDCKKLQTKIKRLNELSARNKQITVLFSRQMIDQLNQISNCEHLMTNEHKENFYNLCEQLAEVDSKINDMKQDILCEMHLYDENQQKWFDDLSKQLQLEIQTNCSKFYKTFIETLDSSNQFNKMSSDEQTALNSTYEQTFQENYSKISDLITKIETNSTEFNQLFEQQTTDFLNQNKISIESSTNDSITKLNQLSTSVELVQKDLTELKTQHNDLESNVFQALDSFANMINQFSASFKKQFDCLNDKYQDINQKNCSNLSDLKQIKSDLKLNETTMILTQTNQFIDLVHKPVLSLMSSNNNCLNELNKATSQLKENYLNGKDKIDKSIQQISAKHEQNNVALNELTTKQFNQLINSNTQMVSNIESQKVYTNEFFIRINRDKIGADCDAISTITKKSLSLTEQTQMSMENLSENSKNFYQDSVQFVDKYTNKDLSDDVPSGLSPPPKVYFNPIEFAASKRNSLLIEEFRAKKLELDLLKVPTDSRGSSRPNSPDIVSEPVVAVAQPVATASKRGIMKDDAKENREQMAMDKNSKGILSKNPKIRRVGEKN